MRRQRGKPATTVCPCAHVPMNGMPFWIQQCGRARFIQQSAPLDAKVVHHKSFITVANRRQTWVRWCIIRTPRGYVYTSVAVSFFVGKLVYSGRVNSPDGFLAYHIGSPTFAVVKSVTWLATNPMDKKSTVAKPTRHCSTDMVLLLFVCVVSSRGKQAQCAKGRGQWRW